MSRLYTTIKSNINDKLRYEMCKYRFVDFTHVASLVVLVVNPAGQSSNRLLVVAGFFHYGSFMSKHYGLSAEC